MKHSKVIVKHPKITAKSFKKAELDRKKNQFKETSLPTESVNDVIDELVYKLRVAVYNSVPGNDKWFVSRNDLMELSTNVLKLVGVKLV